MRILCCGVWQSTNDVETYLSFDKYKVIPLTKTHVDKKKVYQEIVYSFSCVKCGGVKVKVFRIGRLLGRKTTLETENYEYDDAINYLAKTAKKRTYIEIPSPAKPPIIVSKFIPMAYWKREDAFTQRKRYLNEHDYADRFENKEVIPNYFIPLWLPDTVKHEVKILQMEKTKIKIKKLS